MSGDAGAEPDRDALMRELGVTGERRQWFFSGYTYFHGGGRDGEATLDRQPSSKYRVVGDGVFVTGEIPEGIPITFPLAVDRRERPFWRIFYRVRVGVLGSDPALYLEVLWRPDWPHAIASLTDLTSGPTNKQVIDLVEAGRALTRDFGRGGRPRGTGLYRSREEFMPELDASIDAERRSRKLTAELVAKGMGLSVTAFLTYCKPAPAGFDVDWQARVLERGGMLRRRRGR